MAELRRRDLIKGGVAGGVGIALGGAESAPAAARRRAAGRLYDVAVVGAGLAGLTAARHVRAAGRSTIVLEARHRVGGRNLDHPLGGGQVVELGGQWAGPGQDRVLALARELGVRTFPTYSTGRSVYYRSGRVQTYAGDVPPADPVALGQLETMILGLNSMASTVSAEHPWTAQHSEVWDGQTIATWMTEHLASPEALDLGLLAIRGVYGEDATEISLLDLLAAIRGVGGDLNTLIGSAQSIRFEGGPQQLSQRLARRLGGLVRLGVPILAIEQDGPTTLRSEGLSFRARQVIITLPKPLIGRIRFSPVLPAAHDQILQRQPMGSVVKVNAIYQRPFWREQGLNGAATSDTGPIRITYDNSPPGGRPGVLVGLMEGNDSRRFYGASVASRRRAALDSLARYFGDPARHPIGYADLAWAEEPYTRGAYGSYNPPGVLTSLGDATSARVGSLHFAGADISALWPGYMDGAIRSGERAADEALRAL